MQHIGSNTCKPSPSTSIFVPDQKNLMQPNNSILYRNFIYIYHNALYLHIKGKNRVYLRYRNQTVTNEKIYTCLNRSSSQNVTVTP